VELIFYPFDCTLPGSVAQKESLSRAGCCSLEAVVPDLQIRENVPLAPFTTLGIGGSARYFVVATTEEDVASAVRWAADRGVKLFVLGGGSNLLVRDTGFDGMVVRIAVRGIESCGEGCVSAGAGENWDSFVDYAIGLGLAGVECLAGIPGSVGGTPVQNVGAYGQEVAETIESVRAFDRETMGWVDLSKVECRFRYRESVFNTDEPGRYIVTRVRFRLRPQGEPNLRYADLQRRLGELEKPTLGEVAKTVRGIRHEKGMLLVEGEADCRSAGSFFKNPIVGVEALGRVAAAAGVDDSKVPHWPVGEGRTKLPAAWLLERAGFVKGYGEGRAGISTRHTLALTNRGGATSADIERLQEQIVSAVRERFGIVLEREPVLLG
jgi:UDP-N-acetylmuramate dehydrogenase